MFLGRFVAFFRAVMPALADTARMPYRTFLAYNAAGGLVWRVRAHRSTDTKAPRTREN